MDFFVEFSRIWQPTFFNILLYLMYFYNVSYLNKPNACFFVRRNFQVPYGRSVELVYDVSLIITITLVLVTYSLMTRRAVQNGTYGLCYLI